MRKVVVSETLDNAEWNNSTVLRGDVVDEYRLMVFPIVLGSGKRLFGDSGRPTTLCLAETKPVGSDGVVVLTYESAPRKEAATGS